VYRRSHGAASDQQGALAIVRESGDRYGEAVVMWHLGRTLQDIHQHQRGQTCWKDTLAVFEELGASQAEEVRRLLLDRPERVSAPVGERIDAAVLVSDIAGSRP
jgi:hypothetical protein